MFPHIGAHFGFFYIVAQQIVIILKTLDTRTLKEIINSWTVANSRQETKIRLLNDWKCNSVANDPRIRHKQVKMLFALYSAQCGKVEQNNWKLDCRIYLLPTFNHLLTSTCTVGRKQWLYKLLYLEKAMNELIWLLVILKKKHLLLVRS